MRKLLVCTDFSEPALHAAKYACALATEYGFQYITLFHAYESIMPTTGFPLDTYSNTGLYKTTMQQLKDLQQSLSNEAVKDITFNLRAEELTLAVSIDDICREENVDMVVMGVTGKSKFEKAIMGSNAEHVSQNSHYPVLIVPAEAPIQPVRNILFASDLNNVSTSTPVDSFGAFLDMFKARLIIINVDSKNRKFMPQTPEEISHLHHIFDKYQPKYAFLEHEDVTAAILEYAEKHLVSLIVTIQKNYNFFQKLFHRSTTDKLIYKSAIPLLTLHK